MSAWTQKQLVELRRKGGAVDRWCIARCDTGAVVVSARGFSPTSDGKLLPDRDRGISINPKDLRAVIAALTEAANELEAERAQRAENGGAR